jgi:hypothetical protein
MELLVPDAPPFELKRVNWRGFPLSMIVKSFASRPSTGFPCASRTLTSTSTIRTSDLILTAPPSCAESVVIDKIFTHKTQTNNNRTFAKREKRLGS